MQNTETKPIPLFYMTTAYKTLLSFQKNKQENSIDALFVYIDGIGVGVSGNSLCDLGIEKYQFANSEYCNDWYNLLHKIKDYELFLNQEVYENGLIAKYAKPYVDAFDARYSEIKRGLFKRFKDERKLWPVITRPVNMNAFSNMTVWHVTSKRMVYDFVDIKDCEPVFNTVAVFNQKTPDVYVYELRLIENTENNIYEPRPCINISLFKDVKNANKYYQMTFKETEKFKTHPEYARLAEKNYSAIQRFEKYMKTR